MKFRYDLHIHSALSPCADNEMTPVTIVGQAKLCGLDFVAVSDHNSIKNVEVALKAGEAYDITVVPAMELQTNEDIHLLCLFETYDDLKAFFDSVRFSTRLNREDIFGEQLILDEDDNVVGKEKTMLLDSADISSEDVPSLAAKFNGIAIPAHLDREGNSMLAILGDITDKYKTVELSTKATKEQIDSWAKRFKVIVDSDSHTIDNISDKSEIDLPSRSVKALIDALR